MELTSPMDYFKILSLDKEPFSNSPDPEFFFHSRQHQACLQKLEISLRLRRGLSVVIGEVGTGKTTLCRQMIRRFADDETAETHLILDPSFSTPSEFLMTVAQSFGISDYPASGIQKPASRTHHPEPSIQHPESRIQKPASGIQNPESRIQKPASGIQNPESRIQKPASGIQNPASRIQKPASGIQKPESRIRHPASGIQNPESRIRHPASGIQNPESRIQKPASGIQNPESRIRHPASGIQNPASRTQHPEPSIQNPEPDNWQLKESIRQYLFRSGAEEDKTVILIIDEGQKLPGFCIEILREFLNYETNIYKLLQIAIFAQREFEDILRERPNFADRVDLYHILEPLNFTDTRQMIRFRLDQSGRAYGQPDIFTYLGMWAIFRATRGYPRKIVTLCHRVILTLIIQNRSRAGWAMVRSCAKRNLPISEQKPFFYRSSVLCVIFALLTAFFIAANHFGKLSVGGSGSSVGSRELPVVSRESSAADHNVSVMSRESSVKTETEKAADTPQPTTDNPQPTTDNRQPTTDTLGEIAVERGKTLGGLMRQIYGTASPRHQEAVLRANPQMTSPDRLVVGQRIAFPAIPFVPKPELGNEENNGKRCWIEMSDTESLEAAIRMSDLLSRKSDASLSFQMIPYQNREGEIRFKIVLAEYFSDESAARSRMKDLPAARGRILSSWDDGTIFFANPY